MDAPITGLQNIFISHKSFIALHPITNQPHLQLSTESAIIVSIIKMIIINLKIEKKYSKN
jgi:hypothetical protein